MNSPNNNNKPTKFETEKSKAAWNGLNDHGHECEAVDFGFDAGRDYELKRAQVLVEMFEEIFEEYPEGMTVKRQGIMKAYEESK